MELRRTLNGAAAGAAAAAAWAAQQPLDKRLFDCSYDDVELLGKLATRDSGWPAAGLALHLQNGALFGALYAHLRPFLPGPPVLRGALAGLAEHAGLWPLVRLTDRYHPARKELPALAGSRRALLQATWRHLLFGAVLGELERRLNPQDEFEPPGVPVSSNGQGDIERAAVATA
ncbi:MAG: hypothetical protein ABR581_04430 [Thermoleophilaceae bacterium]